ncbi:CHAT domain-containing protein [Streptomyces sp. NPDC004647]|uniref:CHAT domain-containing WD40 repeat protein n=1 Tax=Streptomyces sp. NPDC004647 TaxID=3154671 RepID=UPI0033A499F1
MEALDVHISVYATGDSKQISTIRTTSGTGVQSEYPLLTADPRVRALLRRIAEAVMLSATTFRRIPTPEEEPVRELGERLYASLFSGRAEALLLASRDQAAREQRELRIVLEVQSPELARLPWEYMYDPAANEYLAFDHPLIRELQLMVPQRPLSVAAPLRILGVVCRPPDLARLDVEVEQRQLREALDGLLRRGLVELSWVPGQTWRDLQRALVGEKPHVLHFIGHGGFDPRSGEGTLAFTGEATGTSRPMSASSFALLLQEHTSLRLVVLNACGTGRADPRDLFSSVAAALLRKGVPAVVAMQFAISDEAAWQFSRTFYERIAEGSPVHHSVTAARRNMRIAQEESLEWGIPMVYLRASSGRIFDIAAFPGTGEPVRGAARDPGPEPAPVTSPPAVALPLPASVPELLSVPEPVRARERQLVTREPELAPEPGPAPRPEPVQASAAKPNPAPEPSPAQASTQVSAGAPAPETGTLPPTSAQSAPPARPEHARAVDLRRRGSRPPGPGAAASVGAFTGVHHVRTIASLFPVHSVSLGPQGEQLAVGGGSRVVRVVDVAKGRDAYQLRLGLPSGTRVACFSPDGRFVAASSRRSVRIWHAADGTEVTTIDLGHDVVTEPRRIAFSPDGTLIATCGWSAAGLWSTEDGRCVHRLPVSAPVTDLAFGHRGRHLVTIGRDGRILLWDTRGRHTPVRSFDRPGLLNAVSFLRDGERFATAGADGCVRVWTLPHGTATRLIPHQASVNAVAFSVDGRWMGAGCDDGRACLWAMSEEAEGERPLVIRHDGPVTSVAFSADSRFVATGSTDHNAQIWQLGENTDD